MKFNVYREIIGPNSEYTIIYYFLMYKYEQITYIDIVRYRKERYEYRDYMDRLGSRRIQVSKLKESNLSKLAERLNLNYHEFVDLL